MYITVYRVFRHGTDGTKYRYIGGGEELDQTEVS